MIFRPHRRSGASSGETTRPRDLRAVGSRLFARLVAAVALALIAAPAIADMNDPLATRLAPEVVEGLFPDAGRLGDITGDPPLAPVFDGGEIVGYLFSTHEMVRPAGYSGNSFDIIVALSKDGVILGHRMLEEHEPLVGPGLMEPENFRRFLSGLDGTDIRTTRTPAPGGVDAVSGATISALLMRRAILDSAILVGYLRGIIVDGGDRLSLDLYNFEERSWPDLVAEGAIRALTLSNGEVRAAFASRLGDPAEPETELGADGEPFLTLYTALATVPTIGRNLFSARAYRAVMQSAKVGEHQLLVASSGAYRWMPHNPWLVPAFERVRIVQNGKVMPLLPDNFSRAWHLAIDNHPALDYAARFSVPASMDFRPLEPWALELRLVEKAPEDMEARSVDFALPYRVPARYVLGDDPALEDAGFKEPRYVGFGLWRESTLSDWQQVWMQKRLPVLGLAGLLVAVTLVMLFQHRLSRSRHLHAILRIAVLAITLVWLGWVAGAQLTILTVMNYLHAAFGETGWRSILFDPLMVILSVYVAISVLLWGRGVFCGWLCPFGALQELLNKVARTFRVPQLTVPQTVQSRLWALKYVLAAAILGLAAYSLSTASIAAEIEPFKTAISLRFQRDWPYVLYAGALLSAALFIDRLFCRYLCPLGAVLALVGRFHVLDWLKRRPECGNPCRICEASCPVGAVEESGAINMSECLQYLECQVDYFDDQRCPPLVTRRRQLDGLRQPLASDLLAAGE
jgi:NosR/NirI family nitrous oxide reductase transcriptional regulator